MDKTTAYKLAGDYIDSIGTKYTIIQAYLFGSYAKGNFTEESDIDVAVVVDNVEDIIDVQIEMMKLRRKIDLRIEPHPFNQTDFNSNDPLASEVMRHGIAIGV